jgi:hypothetical protein
VLPWPAKGPFLYELSNATRWTYLWSRDQKRKITPFNAASKSQSVLSGASLPEDLVVNYAPIVLDYVHRDYRLAGYFVHQPIRAKGEF